MKTSFKILRFFLVYFLLSYVYYYFLEQMGYVTSLRVTLSVLFGFFALVGWLAFKSALTLRSDRQILDLAQQGVAPRHGRRSAVLGTIKALKEPLLSPFSQKPCVAYQYNVHHITRSSHPSSSSTGTPESYDFEGWASAPAVIQAESGDVLLTGIMDIQDFALNKNYDYENADKYIAATTFLKSSLLNIFSLNKMTNSKDPVTGAIRSDVRHTDAKTTAGLNLEECVVPVDTKVCALGKFSSKNKGTIKNAKLIKGDYSNVSKRLKGDFSGRIITGLLMLVTAMAMIYMNPAMLTFINQIPNKIIK